MLEACYCCRRLFNNSINELFCPNCAPKMEVKIDAMKKYIKENEGATIKELATTFDIEPAVIKKLQRKNLISVMGTCKRCGEDIADGTICKECKAREINRLSSVTFVKPTLVETKAKMRFLGFKR